MTVVRQWSLFVVTVGALTMLNIYCTRPVAAQDVVYNDTDARLAIAEAAGNHGVSEAWLLRVARCEAGPGLNPYAVGRQGELGLAQLAPWGELKRFYSLGYSNPFNPYEAMDFMAMRFSVGGSRAWSCS